jgi:hypothetical protein
MTTKIVALLAVGLIASTLTSACDNASGPQDVTGAYVATQLLTTSNSVITNQLAAGASVNLTLKADGTTAGHLTLPASATLGAAVDADLTGTWTMAGDSVRFQQSADTFIRDMWFAAFDNKLVADKIFGSTEVRVELTRQ